MSYSVEDVIGKSLYAGNAKIPLLKIPYDDVTPFAYVNPGQLIGVVDSWIDPKPSDGRAFLYWQYYDSSGNTYWTAHKPNIYDEQRLREQGLLTDAEKKAAADEANKPWYEKLFDKAMPWIIGGTIATVAVKGAVAYLSRPKNSNN